MFARDLVAQELLVFLRQGSFLRRLASHFLGHHDHQMVASNPFGRPQGGAGRVFAQDLVAQELLVFLKVGIIFAEVGVSLSRAS